LRRGGRGFRAKTTCGWGEGERKNHHWRQITSFNRGASSPKVPGATVEKQKRHKTFGETQTVTEKEKPGGFGTKSLVLRGQEEEGLSDLLPRKVRDFYRRRRIT